MRCNLSCKEAFYRYEGSRIEIDTDFLLDVALSHHLVSRDKEYDVLDLCAVLLDGVLWLFVKYRHDVYAAFKQDGKWCKRKFVPATTPLRVEVVPTILQCAIKSSWESTICTSVCKQAIEDIPKYGLVVCSALMFEASLYGIALAVKFTELGGIIIDLEESDENK